MAAAETMFDESAMARGHSYFTLSDWAVSPVSRFVAWAENLVGRRQCDLKVKDLATGKGIADTVAIIEPNVVWGGRQPDDPLYRQRPGHAARLSDEAHILGQPSARDTLLYE